MAPEQFLARATDARTDQFSFCVALHEALYGERPFPSESFSALLEAVVGGRVREPAQKTRAPSFLRKLLLRGLAADPAARYPSMRALLEVLRHDPIRRRRTWRWARRWRWWRSSRPSGCSGSRRAASGCAAGRAKSWPASGSWATTASAASAIHRAFLGTGRAFAEETWTRVSRLLDDYSRRWTGMYTDTCEATHVRGDQSAEVLDLRMTCLEGPRGALRALTDVLSRTDAAVLVEAVNAAQALPPLERCADVPALRAVVPPPADASHAGARRRARKRPRRGQGPHRHRPMAGGAPQGGTLVEAARAVGYEPLLAETLATQGWLEIKRASCRRDEELEAAVWAALAAHRDDIAAEAAAQAAWRRPAITWAARRGRAVGEGGGRASAASRTRARSIGGVVLSGSRQHPTTTGQLPGRALRLSSRRSRSSRRFWRRTTPTSRSRCCRSRPSDNELGDHVAALVAADKAVDIFRNAYGSSSPQWRFRSETAANRTSSWAATRKRSATCVWQPICRRNGSAPTIPGPPTR